MPACAAVTQAQENHEIGAEPDQPSHLGGMASSLRLLWPKSEGFGCRTCHQVRTFTEVPKKCLVAH